MTRSITSAMQTELDSQISENLFLVQVNLDSGVKYYTDASIDVSSVEDCEPFQTFILNSHLLLPFLM